MITKKNKLITVLSVFILIILLAGFGCFRTDKGVKSPDIESVNEIAGTNVGGVVSKMPDNSAKILFESLLGVKLRGFQSYNNVEETISALRANEIQAAWFSDVTANYLLKTQEGLHLIETEKPSEPRLEFAMALQKDNTALREEINRAMSILKAEGTLDSLASTYIENADTAKPFYASDMGVRQTKTKGTLYVGVTGATPPIDMLDNHLRPYGYSVALMDRIGSLLGKNIEFVVLKNDTAFSMLMSGKVDLLFCYGTSKNTMVDVKNYIMTSGYYTMYQYSYLVLE